MLSKKTVCNNVRRGFNGVQYSLLPDNFVTINDMLGFLCVVCCLGEQGWGILVCAFLTQLIKLAWNCIKKICVIIVYYFWTWWISLILHLSTLTLESLYSIWHPSCDTVTNWNCSIAFPKITFSNWHGPTARAAVVVLINFPGLFVYNTCEKIGFHCILDSFNFRSLFIFNF